MANIDKELGQIKKAVYGKEVRGSIHDGIDKINKETESTTNEQETLRDMFKQLIIDEGNSNAEVVASRGKEDWLPDRLNSVDSQLADTVNQLPKFDRIQIESADETHFDSYTYTAFFTGANINGKEVHIARSGMHHLSEGGATYVAYVRQDDGSFIKKEIDGLNLALGDPRDPNLSITGRGNLILTGAVLKSDGTYTNMYYVLDEDLTINRSYEIIGMEGFFKWGNTLSSSDNRLLMVGYQPSSVSSQRGVYLFKNKGPAGSLDMDNIVELFPPGNGAPTECTIGFWGRKIIAVTRQNNGNMLYRETMDLTGETGWGDIIDLGFDGHAPQILTYTPESDPLVLTASAYEVKISVPDRSPYIRKLYNNNGLIISNPVMIDELKGKGGYNSLVPNRNSYGLMYYEDVSDTRTNVFYREINIDSLLKETAMLTLSSDKFYDADGWVPEIEILQNVESAGNVYNARYTRVGRMVTCQFELRDVQTIASGLSLIAFTLPMPRGGSIVTGNVHTVSSNRDSSGYVAFRSASSDTQCIATINTTDNRIKNWFVEATYQIPNSHFDFENHINHVEGYISDIVQI